ncbi:Pentatricopeptide repeat-containing protein CRP1, chloroplastic [Glycine soja]|uniref:Pentatricopeptide repeat-containing protein CRP1, chloroplastic n=1 Tax=Glycine soja TaxID=3848 RepID=A0A445HVG3_GLYSO|nr:Pentatricopeptide repeat-containing protein CRP1, chloroplastic [Glycine soja]
MDIHSVFCSMQISLSYNRGNPLLRFSRAIVIQCSKKHNFLKSPNRWVRNKGVKDVGSEFDSKTKSIKTTLFRSPDIGENEELSSNLCSQLICECCKEGDLDRAMSLLSQMEAKGFHLSSTSYACLIEALGNVGRTSEADMLFKEMVCYGYKPKLNLYHSLLRGFLKKGLLGLANGVLKEMDDLGIWRSKETYQIFLDYYVGAGRLEDTWSTINEMKQKGFPLNSFMYSKVVGIYRDNGMWKKAIEVLEEIRERGISLDTHICNSIIDTFGKYGELDEALKLFKKMQKEGVRPNIVTWNSLIKWHCKEGDFMKAFHLFTDMQEQGLYPDPKIFVTIISCLGEQGKWDIIKKYFESMKIRGNKEYGAVYAVLVDIYGQYGKFQNAGECVQALKSEGVLVSPSIFCVLANAYAQQGLCEQVIMVLQIMEAEGIEPNIVMLNMLINAFGNAGRYMEAISVYHHIKESGVSPDVVTYTTLMKAFIRAKKFDEVPIIYKEMENDGCTPDRKARQMLQLIDHDRLIIKTRMLLAAKDAMTCQLLIEYGILRQISLTISRPRKVKLAQDTPGVLIIVLIKESVVLCYPSKHSGFGGGYAQTPDDAWTMFKSMEFQNLVSWNSVIAGSQPDIVSWTALISAFAEQDPEQAFLLFCQLHRQSYLPDWYTFSIALKASTYFATEQRAMDIHSQVIKEGFQEDTVLCNALIHAYAWCGSLALSKQVFNEMGCRDLVSWNSMLKSYAIHGQTKDAVELFQRMNVCTDSATFVALLSACSHVGFVDEGVKLFNCMSDDHGVVPQLDHYSCMVDLYGGAGKIFEAEELIRKMPMKPDSVIWSSLLGSCRKHGETPLAKSAADKFKELDQTIHWDMYKCQTYIPLAVVLQKLA